MTASNALNGTTRGEGIAGVDLMYSWHWTHQTRLILNWLPIDYYRVKRPKGLDVLRGALTERLLNVRQGTLTKIR